MSSHNVAITMNVIATPESACDVSVACSVNPASARIDAATRRPVRVPPACAAQPVARRRRADVIHAVGRERGGVA